MLCRKSDGMTEFGKFPIFFESKETPSESDSELFGIRKSISISYRPKISNPIFLYQKIMIF